MVALVSSFLLILRQQMDFQHENRKIQMQIGLQKLRYQEEEEEEEEEEDLTAKIWGSQFFEQRPKFYFNGGISNFEIMTNILKSHGFKPTQKFDSKHLTTRIEPTQRHYVSPKHTL